MVKTTDYIFCESCKEYLDFWKYGDIKDTAHGDCKWRYVTKEELKELATQCKEGGCFEEDICGIEIPSEVIED